MGRYFGLKIICVFVILLKIFENATLHLMDYCNSRFTNAVLVQLLGDSHESKSVDILAENVDELCKITREKLLVSEGEEKSRLEYIYNVIGRAKKSHDLILVLQKQLGEAIQNKNDTVRLSIFSL